MIHKVITVKQPWARLIAQGVKNIENRTWKTNYRGRVLIHASSIPVKMINPNSVFTKEQWNSLSDGIQKEIICGKDYVNSAIIGSIEIVDCVQNHPSVWAEKGVYNWVLANPILFDKPIEGVKGKLSFWEYELLEEPKHAPTYMRRHMAMNLAGLLRNYGRRSLKGFFFDEKGREMSDAECREYIAECQAKGWKVIPMCGEAECPNFDHFDKGCPGHRITKEEYERGLE